MASTDFWGSVSSQTPASTPNRGTSEQELDQWNQQLRASPVYQNFMRAQGLSTDGRVKLSRKQQEQLEQALTRAGWRIPGGMHIDQGGNLNQKNRLGRNIAIGAGIAGAAFGGAAALGAFGGAGAGGAGAAGAAGGSSLGGGLASAGGLAGAAGAAGPFTAAGLGATAGGYGTLGALGGSSLGGGLASPAAMSGAGAGGAAPLTASSYGTGAGTAAAAGGGTPWWQTALRLGIPTAASLGQGILTNNAIDDASEAQRQATAEAMGIQDRIYTQGRNDLTNIYNRQYADLGPYRDIGSGALGGLTQMMGYPSRPAAPMPAPAPPAAPSPAPAPSPTQAPAVTLQAPTGQQITLPSGDPRIQHYTARGARQVA